MRLVYVSLIRLLSNGQGTNTHRQNNFPVLSFRVGNGASLFYRLLITGETLTVSIVTELKQ